MIPDLSTTVAGIPLATCLYNASGPRSGNSTVLAKICASSSTGAVLSKSATLQAQTGNPQPRIHHADNASFNSEGLPNNGIDYYINDQTIDEILNGETAAAAPTDRLKPYIVSLSGKTLADNLQMLQKIADTKNPKIRAIELNLACPNIIGKPIIAYDIAQMRDILQQVSQLVQRNKNMPPLGIKLAPYLDFVQLQQVSELINEFKSTVRYIVTINTLGNALALDMDAQQPYISSNDGFAGMSGPAVHYTAVANVRQLRKLLDPSIDIVGVGGVSTGVQAAALLLAGAAAVQLGTVHWKEGPACFDRVAQELRQYMVQHGFENIAALQASWHLWTKEGAAKSRMAKKESNAASKTNVTTTNGSQTNLFVLLSAILAVLVAMLVADKVGMVSLG